MDITQGIVYTVATGVVLAFVLLVYKDARILVTRSPGLGLGFGRIWAVARVTVAEAWAARAWTVPLIWLVACTLITLLSRVYDDTERINLYLRVLLGGQEFLSLVLLGVMACYSFPRERDRRTIITTASKPLSRLEYYLGKVVGFATVAALLLGSMTALTWGYMMLTNEYVKHTAALHLANQQKEYDDGKFGAEPPSPALRKAAAEGELHAYDYITGTMQIAGGIDYRQDPPALYIRGGSAQKARYVLGLPRRGARSRTHLSGVPATPYRTPFFFFHFGYTLAPGATLTEIPKINVTLSLADNPMILEQRTLALGRPGTGAPLTYASWAVEDPYKFFWYDMADEVDPGPLVLDVACASPDIYLRVYTGNNPNEKDVQAVDLDGSRLPGGAGQLAALGVPELRGFEKGDEQQIEGTKPGATLMSEVASWRFKNIKRGDLPEDKDGKFTLSLQLDEDRSDPNSKTEYVVRAYPIFDPRNAFEFPRQVVDEKRTVELKVPATLLDKTGSDFIVDLRCLTPRHWIGATDTSVRLDRTPSFFTLNLLKSELVIFCECALLILIGVTYSIRLGWPVALLLTGVCYLLGNLFDFVENLVKDNGYALLSLSESRGMKGSLVYQFGVGLMGASVHLLHFLVNALPRFTHFDAVKYIVEARTMPWIEVGHTLEIFGFYALPFLALGYLLIRKQELA